MPVKDLREWMEKVDEMGELLRIDNAHWDLEIGAITDLYQQRPGSPALLFDRVPGYPEGYRVLSNSCMSLKRIAFSFEIPTDLSPTDSILLWREKEKNLKFLPPTVVFDPCGAAMAGESIGNLSPSRRGGSFGKLRTCCCMGLKRVDWSSGTKARPPCGCGERFSRNLVG